MSVDRRDVERALRFTAHSPARPRVEHTHLAGARQRPDPGAAAIRVCPAVSRRGVRPQASWFELGEPERIVLVSRTAGYHGTHGFGTALAGIPGNREGFGPQVETLQVPHDSLEAMEAEIKRVGGRGAGRRGTAGDGRADRRAARATAPRSGAGDPRRAGSRRARPPARKGDRGLATADRGRAAVRAIAEAIDHGLASLAAQAPAGD